MLKAAGSTCLRPCFFPVIPAIGFHALHSQLRKNSVIFSNATLIESEKERNLCTKFFAGYFFNEFTAGYAKRIVHFNRYIQEVTGREDLALQSPNVSFDTHAYLCHERLRSKLSDVLISDPARQVFLFIEPKYLPNWTSAAAVAKGLERLDKVFDTEKKPHLADAKHHYFVLTSRRKEEAAERTVRSYPPVHLPIYVPTPMPAAAAVVEDEAAEPAKATFTSLLYWEDLTQMCDRSEVRQYMEARLKQCINGSRNQHKSTYFLPGA